MAQVALVRADFRLIHGQVVTKWLKQTDADKIVIINDMLAEDDFLQSVYTMAAPSGIEVEVYSIEEGITQWNDDGFGEGIVLMLFQSVKDALAFQKLGFPISEFQIGGLGSGTGKVTTFDGVSFSKDDIEDLKEMNEKGTKVYIQVVPSSNVHTFDDVIRKFQF